MFLKNVLVACVGGMPMVALSSCDRNELAMANPGISIPSTRPAADQENYQIPPDATHGNLPCHPGLPYSRIEAFRTQSVMVGKRFYRHDGSLYSEELFRDGIRFGICKEFYPDGKIKRAMPYRDGRLDGPCCGWRQDGTFIGSFDMKMGTGIALNWDGDGHLIESSEQKDGEKDGLTCDWYPNGVIEQEAYYKDGVQNGLERQFDDNGIITSTATLKVYEDESGRDSVLHGVLREYDSSSGGKERPQSPQYYVNNLQVSKGEYIEAAKSDLSLPPIDVVPSTQP